MNKLPVILRLLSVVWLVLFVAPVSRPFAIASMSVILNHHHTPPWLRSSTGPASAPSSSTSNSPLSSSPACFTSATHETLRSCTRDLVRNASEVCGYVLSRFTVLLPRPKFNSVRRLTRSIVLYIRAQHPTRTTPPAGSIPPTPTISINHPAPPIPGHAWRGKFIFNFNYAGTAYLEQPRQRIQELPDSLGIFSYIRKASQRVNLGLMAGLVGAALGLLLGLRLVDSYYSDSEFNATGSSTGPVTWIDMVLVDVEIVVRLQFPSPIPPPVLYISSGSVTRELNPLDSPSEVRDRLLGEITIQELASLEELCPSPHGAQVEVTIDVLAGPYSAYIDCDGVEHQYNHRIESSRKLYTVDLSTHTWRSNVWVPESIAGATRIVTQQVVARPSITYFKPTLGRMAFSRQSNVVQLLMVPNKMFIGLLADARHFTLDTPWYSRLIGWGPQEKTIREAHIALNIEPPTASRVRPERSIRSSHLPYRPLGLGDSSHQFDRRAKREMQEGQGTLGRPDGEGRREVEGGLEGPERPKRNKRGGWRARERAARRVECVHAIGDPVTGGQAGE